MTNIALKILMKDLERSTPKHRDHIINKMNSITTPEEFKSIAPLVYHVLKYPVYNPYKLNKNNLPLYSSAIRSVKMVGYKRPDMVRRLVPNIFQIYKDTHHFEPMRKRAGKSRGTLREQTIDALKTVGIAAPDLVVPEIIDGLFDTKIEIKRGVEGIIKTISVNYIPYVASLVISLSSENPEKRRIASELLIKQAHKDPQAVMPLILKRIDHKKKNVRVMAINIIGPLIPRNPDFIPNLVNSLFLRLNWERSNDVKHAIANALTIVNFFNLNIFKDHMPHLIRAMNDNYYFVRWRCIQIIKNLGIFKKEYVVDALSVLIKRLDDSHPVVAKKAKETLAALKVDKLEYLQAMRCISTAVEAFEVARKQRIESINAKKTLVDAIRAVKRYEFRESVFLTATALGMLEEEGAKLSSSVYPQALRNLACSSAFYEEELDKDFINEIIQESRFPKQESAPILDGDYEKEIHEKNSVIIPPPPPMEELDIKDGNPTPGRENDSRHASKWGIDEIFLMTNYGILIEHFVTSKKSYVDEDILASMLIAVNSFIQDTFHLPKEDEKGGLNLNSLDFGDFSVIISNRDYLVMVTITNSGKKEEIYRISNRWLKDLENRYSNVLKDWNGDKKELLDLPEYLIKLITEDV